MREETGPNLHVQLERVLLPVQQLSSLLLNNVERVTDFQLELMQRYTHFAIEQWRDALEVHDARSFRDYLDKRSRSLQELSRTFSDDFRRLLGLSQEIAEQTRRAAERIPEGAVAAAQAAAAEPAQRSSGRRA